MLIKKISSLRKISCIMFSFTVFITILSLFTNHGVKVSLLKQLVKEPKHEEENNYKNKKNDDMPSRVNMNSKEMKNIYNENLGRNVDRELNPITQLNWSNLVIVILTYNSIQPNRLVKAHFNTWIKRAGEGLDIVFVTDDDDERTYDKILPDADKVKPSVHLYKSNAKKEGNLAREKVIDSLIHVYQKFENDNRKHLFIKIDTDTFLIAENIIKSLNELYQITHPLPVDFGWSFCFSEISCYTQGGFYGMSKAGLDSTLSYLSKHAETYKEYIENDRAPGENLILHEDFFTSYIFQKATGFPSISMPDVSVSTNLIHPNPIEHISVHKAKPCQRYYSIEDSFYDQNGDLRDKFQPVKPNMRDVRCLN